MKIESEINGTGYIKLHRQILESRLWSFSDASFRVAIYFMLSANHKPKFYRGIKIERGQCIRSLTRISDECNISRKAARYAIKLLTADNFIFQDTPFGAQQGHRITICKYDAYQSIHPDKGTQRAHEGHTEGTEGNTNKNEENEKNDKNERSNIDIKKANFKTWTPDQFQQEIAENNQDGLLDTIEADKFFNYWLEPDVTGRPKRALLKTWSTRGRMVTWNSFLKARYTNPKGGTHARESESDRRRREKAAKEYDDINEIEKHIPSTF